MPDYKIIPNTLYEFKNTAIAVETAEYDSNIIIPEHTHEFQEFVMILSGACIHNFKNIEVPLVKGDVFLIPPHMPHSYLMNSHIHFANCYFFPQKLGPKWMNLLRDTMLTSESADTPEYTENDWESVILNIADNKSGSDKNKDTEAALKDPAKNLQGITHLNPREAERVESLLLQIEQEEKNREFGSEHVKAALLQIILITIKRAKDRKPVLKHAPTNKKKELIADALQELDQHFQDPLSVPELAEKSCLSESYFRTVFKDVIGLTPLEYLTRIRVIKSLEFIQRNDLTITEAAEMVGIYDPNYFSRVFKKIMGHSPRYFRKIS